MLADITYVDTLNASTVSKGLVRINFDGTNLSSIHEKYLQAILMTVAYR